MALIKPHMENPPGEPEADCRQLAQLLTSSSAEDRRQAARQLSECPAQAAEMAHYLCNEPNSAVRQAILAGLAQNFSEKVIPSLLCSLRSPDPALRNEVLDAMRQMPLDATDTLDQLLGSAEPHARLAAISLLAVSHRKDVEAIAGTLLAHEPEVNVCAAVVDLLCEVGTEASLPALEELRQRFAGQAYLEFVTALAIKRIQES